MGFVRVNGIDLYFERHGSGSPIVVVPGLGGDSRMFGPLAVDLAENHQVVVLDPRGSGKSDKPRGAYSIPEMADDVSKLVDALGLERPGIVGYSMGGRIAMHLAYTHPQKVRRLVLAATSAHSEQALWLSWRWLMLNVLERVPKPRGFDPQPPHAFHGQHKASSEFDGRPLLDKIDLPALLVRTRRDRIVKRRLAEELRAIPGIEFAEVPGGHLSALMLHHKKLAEVMLAFLDRKEQ